MVGHPNQDARPADDAARERSGALSDRVLPVERTRRLALLLWDVQPGAVAADAFHDGQLPFQHAPLAILRGRQPEFRRARRRRSRQPGRGVGAGLPPCAGAAPAARATSAPPDRTLLARPVSARANLPGISVALGTARGNARSRSGRLPHRLLRHPIPQLLRAHPGPARRPLARRGRHASRPGARRHFSTRHPGRLLRRTRREPARPRAHRSHPPCAAHAARGARGRPSRLHQGHPRAPARLRALSRSEPALTIGASPWC